MLPKLDQQAQLFDPPVRPVFQWIDPIEQLADAKQPGTVLTALLSRRVPILNRSVR